MAWTITNREPNAMTFTTDAGVNYTAQGGQSVVVSVKVGVVAYQSRHYNRVGIWPFPDGQAVDARYDGGRNLSIRNPTTGVTCIFQAPPADD